MLKYSVIVPVYNVENYLSRCIDSLLAQNYADLEILLIDNGSNDQSGQICENYAAQFSNITAYHIPNKGVGSARNFGLSKAKGEFICFVDADDYLVGNLFSDVESQLDSQLDLLVFSYYNSIEKNLSEINRSAKILPTEGKKDKGEFIALFQELWLTDMMYTVWNKIYRKEFLEEHQIIFESYELGEDVRFNLNVYQHVNAVFLVKSGYYVYVSGRVDSAMGQHNPNRMNYQLEELEKIDQLMSRWGIHDEQFVDQIKSRILMSNIQNISAQKIPLPLKRQYVEELCENKEMVILAKKILLLSILLLDSYLIIECIVQCFFLKKYRF